MTSFYRERGCMTLQHPIFGCQSDRYNVEYPSLCWTIWLKSKGDDGLQRAIKATSETRCELRIQEQKVRLLFFCLCLCSPPVLGGLQHKSERERNGQSLMDTLPVSFSTCSSNSLPQNLFCVLSLMIRCLYLLWPAAGQIQPPAHP